MSLCFSLVVCYCLFSCCTGVFVFVSVSLWLSVIACLADVQVCLCLIVPGVINWLESSILCEEQSSWCSCACVLLRWRDHKEHQPAVRSPCGAAEKSSSEHRPKRADLLHPGISSADGDGQTADRREDRGE